jgi:putative hemolysin
MIDGDSLLTAAKLLAVIVLVLANGFFVAAEFSLVGIRRSRVEEMAADGNRTAALLRRAVIDLDANLAATQLGITISSLALGWIGEPALAHLIEPALWLLPFGMAQTTSHVIAVALAFFVITAMHIVLGELAPKSLALQRAERTALAIVRPLRLFLMVFRPAIVVLNGLGNWVLRMGGLQPGTGEGHLHSTEELKLLVAASQQGGLLEPAQQQVVERTFNLGERRARDIMTARPELFWLNANDPLDKVLKAIRSTSHEQIIVCRGTLDDVIGVLRKKDLVDSCLDGTPLDPLVLMREPLAVHEDTSIFKLIEQFKLKPAHMALVLDEYGGLQGVVTPTDLLEALAGDMPDGPLEDPDVVERADGSLLIEGLMSAYDAFDRLGIRKMPEDNSFNTLAGFLLFKLERIPKAGDIVIWEGWRFEVVDMDRRRIDKVLVTRA